MNKYITKIAGLVYPLLKKTEFDLAFEGDANPIRDRILDYLDRKDREKFHRDLNDWRDEGNHYASDPAYYREELENHFDNMPDETSYVNRSIDKLEAQRSDLERIAGKEVPGPNKFVLGTGYGLGTLGVLAGLGLGLVRKDPIALLPIINGAGILAGTGIHHALNTPERQLNRYLERVKTFEKNKNDILNMSYN